MVDGYEHLPADVHHGTANAYNNYNCRCEKCKEAWRDYQLPLVTKRKAKGLPPHDPRHGTYNGYANYGCRCEPCIEANRIYSIGYKLRTGKITADKARQLGWEA